MGTYTADDFARADFARHPDGGLAMRVRPLDVRPWEAEHCYASDATMALTGWVPVPHGSYTRHDSPDYADGGVTAAAIEKEAERVELADDPDYWHAKFCEARQERDELRQTRRRLLGKVDQLEVKLRNSGGSGEQPRALTPDAITEQMIERARRAADAWGHQLLPESMAHILAAALTEPPARPEGAEDVAVRLFQAGAAVGVEMTAEQRDALADHLAAMRVRVVGEDGAA